MDPFGLSACDPPEIPCPPDPVSQAIDNFNREATKLLVTTLELLSDAIDLVVPIKSTATAAGLNPAAQSADARWLAATNLFTGGRGAWDDAAKAAARLTNSQATDLASYLGYQRVKDAPFNSHGELVFSNGKNFLSLDNTMHLGPQATWKLFDRRGNRLGTYDGLLELRLGK